MAANRPRHHKLKWRAKLKKLHDDRPFITETSSSASVGPVELDVALARHFGWSEKAINRAFERLGKISRNESRIAHRKGKVRGCPCENCDPSGVNHRKLCAERRRLEKGVKRS